MQVYIDCMKFIQIVESEEIVFLVPLKTDKISDWQSKMQQQHLLKPGWCLDEAIEEVSVERPSATISFEER